MSHHIWISYCTLESASARNGLSGKCYFWLILICEHIPVSHLLHFWLEKFQPGFIAGDVWSTGYFCDSLLFLEMAVPHTVVLDYHADLMLSQMCKSSRSSKAYMGTRMVGLLHINISIVHNWTGSRFQFVPQKFPLYSLSLRYGVSCCRSSIIN